MNIVDSNEVSFLKKRLKLDSNEATGMACYDIIFSDYINCPIRLDPMIPSMLNVVIIFILFGRCTDENSRLQ